MKYLIISLTEMSQKLFDKNALAFTDYFINQNRLESALCMYQARGQCKTCHMRPPALHLRNNCQNCLIKCETDAGRPIPTFYQM